MLILGKKIGLVKSPIVIFLKPLLIRHLPLYSLRKSKEQTWF